MKYEIFLLTSIKNLYLFSCWLWINKKTHFFTVVLAWAWMDLLTLDGHLTWSWCPLSKKYRGRTKTRKTSNSMRAFPWMMRIRLEFFMSVTQCIAKWIKMKYCILQFAIQHQKEILLSFTSNIYTVVIYVDYPFTFSWMRLQPENAVTRRVVEGTSSGGQSVISTMN